MENRSKEEVEQIAREITHVDLAQLKEKMGYGWNKKLSAWIKKKTKKKFTDEYIRLGLTKNHLRPKILMYAIEYADELEKEQEELVAKARKFLAEKRKNIIQ